MNLKNSEKLFTDAIEQLEKDKRFLEKKKSIAHSNPRKPKMTMVDHHYLNLLPSLIYNFQCIIEDIQDGDEPFDTDLKLAEAVMSMNGHKKTAEEE